MKEQKVMVYKILASTLTGHLDVDKRLTEEVDAMKSKGFYVISMSSASPETNWIYYTVVYEKEN